MFIAAALLCSAVVIFISLEMRDLRKSLTLAHEKLNWIMDHLKVVEQDIDCDYRPRK